MKFYIISTNLLKLPLDGTHILSNRKFAKGFEQNGYEIVEILCEEDVNIIENKHGNIILLSNFMDFDKDWKKIVDFGNKFDNLFYILWCWHNIQSPPFKYWIYTFQEYKLEPEEEPFKEEYILFKELETKNKFIPYRFSSYIDPCSNYKEENIKVNKIYDLVYIGCSYEIDIIEKLKQTNYKSFIHISGGGDDAITGDDFEKIYKQSKICLGFMAEENNKKNTITERIWEAFSFGCLVLTNSKSASLVTNNAAVYYENYEDLNKKINYYLDNEDKRLEKIKEGYEIFEKYANYKFNANQFITFLNTKKLYFIHVPKCAGTTIVKTINHYLQDTNTNTNNGNLVYNDNKYMKWYQLNKVEQYNFIREYNFLSNEESLYNSFDENYYDYFICLRHPISRYLSQKAMDFKKINNRGYNSLEEGNKFICENLEINLYQFFIINIINNNIHYEDENNYNEFLHKIKYIKCFFIDDSLFEKKILSYLKDKIRYDIPNLLNDNNNSCSVIVTLDDLENNVKHKLLDIFKKDIECYFYLEKLYK